ncbi:MAG: 2-oxoacid:acceptor oxidoreductase subunit alpha [Candidatus Lokiarchaeota archaeon]|nr:2-oxoacid:acceptor oxidoreductase subunit alpha [Candidatus Lokiarchaeota archaeon]
MSDCINKDKDNISVVICGAAGQGIQTVEMILTKICKLNGYNIFATREFMSRIRGGINSTEIRVSSKPVKNYVSNIDILIPLNEGAIPHLSKRINDESIIIGEEKNIDNSNISNKCKILNVNFSKIAKDIGGKIYGNIIATGLISGLLEIKKSILTEYIKKFFSSKEKEIIENNKKAILKGYDLGSNFLKNKEIKLNLNTNSEVEDHIVINGAEAVGLGSLAGGCNFISSYPMSPSTAVLVFLSEHMKDFDIVSEQAEDEISAINMGLGAWYAGGRAMITTSGGGFALMNEGLSLAGMIESPMVFHLAQRPGPATGLPTRTEQGDLLFSIFAGHGEFPRVIYAPGTLEDAFYLTQKAFNIADKFQVPVIILTDQYLMDSYYNLEAFDFSEIINDEYIVKTDEGYKRYELNDEGVSPRGVPGYGDGLVMVDSDEHNEFGKITENFDVRVKMVDKRLRKLDLGDDFISPEFVGSKDYTFLILCWGTNYHVVKEAINELNDDRFAILYFKQVYPLPTDIREEINNNSKLILVENNATAQFGMILKLFSDIQIDHKILKYNGLPFSVEEIVESLRGIIK